MVPEHKEKLLERLRQSGLSIDENDDRVVKEIALFAEKSDTSEEITRLESHLEQMKETFELRRINRQKNRISSSGNLERIKYILLKISTN